MPKAKQSQPDYRQLREELDDVLAELQREDLDVDQALKHYQRGLELIRQLEKHLGDAENRIHEVKAKFEAK